MSKFDDCDLAVFEAHSLAESNGGARYWQMERMHDGHLPVQRLSGLVRRGLMTFDGYRYYLTREGVGLAHAYRDTKAATQPCRVCHGAGKTHGQAFPAVLCDGTEPATNEEQH